MDAARRINSELFGDEAPVGAPAGRPNLEGLERVLRFTLQPPETRADEGPILQRGNASITARDITHALDLVHEAAQNIRAAEERARDGEGRTKLLLQRATEELRNAESRLESAEQRIRAAETRASEAEDRAREAEDWLRQIFSTINQELPARR